jgi:hypothetical protein
MHPLEDSAALLLDGPALAARMARDGYLYLPGLLPVDVVTSVQREVAAIARDAGWLRPDTPLADAVADPRGFCVDPEPRYLVVLRQINRLERYHSLKHHPALLGFLERMLGAPVFPHPRVLDTLLSTVQGSVDRAIALIECIAEQIEAAKDVVDNP